MRLLVVYDISDNKAREELAKKLRKLGLNRIQRSCFLGVGSQEKVKHILRISEKLIDLNNDVVHVILLDEYSFRSVRYVGTPYNLRNVGDSEYVFL